MAGLFTVDRGDLWVTADLSAPQTQIGRLEERVCGLVGGEDLRAVTPGLSATV